MKDKLAKPISKLIVTILVTITFGVIDCVDPLLNITELNEIVSNRVLNLLLTGRYNLAYFTDFSNDTYVSINTTARAMVSSDDIRCSRVGAFYLNNGGNAIDAAIATTLCLSVIEFQSTGLCGGGVALSYIRRKLIAIDFREASSHCHICNGTYTINKDGRVFGIPGMMRGLYDMWLSGGQIEWKSLFDVPIIIAFKGWQIKPTFFETIKYHKNALLPDPLLGPMLYQDGLPKPIGEYIRNIPLARTLHMLSNDHDDFYVGIINKIMINQLIAKSIVNTSINFSEYKTNHLDLLIVKLTPNLTMVTTSRRTGGPFLAYMMNAMEEYKNSSTGVFHEDSSVSEDYYPNLVAIIKHSYRDISIDPTKPILTAIQNAYTNYQTRGSIPTLPKWGPKPDLEESMYDMTSDGIHGTVSASVIDKCGNAVAIESSISNLFGAKYSFPILGIVANSKVYTWPYYDKITGAPLYNATDDYITTRHINYVAPTLIVDVGIEKIQGVFASTGGKKSPAALAQVLTNHYLRNISLESSIDHFRLFHPYKPNVVFSESIRPIPLDVRTILRDRNIVVIGSIRQDYSSTVSGICIEYGQNNQTSRIVGAGDFRKNGGAAGY